MSKNFLPPIFIFGGRARPHSDHFGLRGFIFIFKVPENGQKGQNRAPAVTRDLIGRPGPNFARIIKCLRRLENDPVFVFNYSLGSIK